MSPEQQMPILQLRDELVQRVQYGREQCRALVFHSRYFISHLLSRVNPADLQNITQKVTESVTQLSQRSLPWCLIRRQSARKALLDVKDGLAHAFTTYNLDSDSLDTDFIKAQQQDHENLKARCRTLSRSQRLAADLVAAAGHHYGVKELAMAFTKHAFKVAASRRHVTDEVDSFIEIAAAALQKAAGRSLPFPSESENVIPNWCVTSLEVDFNVEDEKRLVGRGAFGRVVEGKWWSGDGAADEKVVAVKAMYVKTDNEGDRKRAEESFRNEVYIWSHLSHPNILPFYGACLESAEPFIISPLCTSKNALIYINANPNADRVRLLHDISLGMIYLHSLGVIHGDLKATNIIMSTNTAPRALIADFGLSVVHEPSSFPTSPYDPSPTPSSFFKSITRTSQREKKQPHKPVGTPRWMAPEVILGKGLTPPADLYGFGMVGWEVMSVRPTPRTDGDTDIYKGLPLPFAHVQDPAMVCQYIVQGERPGRPLPGQGIQDMKEEGKVWEVVERCWKADPAARPDFRWVEGMLEGIMKRTRERPRAGSDTKKRKISLKMPWGRATVDVVVVQGDEAPAPAPAPADDETEFDHRPLPPLPPRQRRPSFLKALASFNLSVLTFSKTSSTGTDGTRQLEWFSRRSNDSRQSTRSRATNLPNPSTDTDLTLLVSSAQALPSLSRSSSLTRSSSNSVRGKLRRRPRGISLDTTNPHSAPQSGTVNRRVAGPGLDMADTVLKELFNLSLTSGGGVEITKDGAIVPAILRQLARPLEDGEQEEEEDKALTSGILANLACHGNARAYLVGQADLIPALLCSLSPAALPLVQENATRCLYNLSTSSQSHSLFFPGQKKERQDGLIHPMVKFLLSPSAQLNAARNILGCFTNLTNKEMGRCTILLLPEVLDALVQMLLLPRRDDDVEDVVKEQALMCLGNLSVDEKGIRTLVGHPDIVLGLAKSLSGDHQAQPMKVQALRCLRNVARSAPNHADILHHTEITSTVSDVLGELSFSASYTAIRAASTNEQKYALHFLHRISGSEVGRTWLKKDARTAKYSGVRNGLKWFTENGTTEEQMRAGDCLKFCGVRDE